MDRRSLISAPMRAWARTAIRRIAERVGPISQQAKRRLLLIHLDGVPKAFFERAIAHRRMPFVGDLVGSGAYHFDGAFWGSPASTASFQASVLFGLRHPDLPAYEWFDRQLGRHVKMNRPDDAVAIERRLADRSRGNLLEGGGTAYLSLFRPRGTEGVSMTSLLRKGDLLKSAMIDLHSIRNVDCLTSRRSLQELSQDALGSVVDVAKWSWAHRDLRHEWNYLWRRVLLLSIAWKYAQRRAMVDMVRGAPAIYLVFGNFDEVAHRRGPFSKQACAELSKADRAIERLYAFAQNLQHPYDLVFLTDHGHVKSVPFEAEVGNRLNKSLLGPEREELPELVERGLLDGRPNRREVAPAVHQHPVVVEAGNFAHVYLTRSAAPLEALELVAQHRDILARAIRLKGIGLAVVRRGDSAVAIAQGNVYGPNEIAGCRLSTAFSKAAVTDLLRELPKMPTAGDIVLFGDVKSKNETIGFAWEFGSHGGLTRCETESFVCWPSDAPLDLSVLQHGTQLYEKLSEVYRN